MAMKMYYGYKMISYCNGAYLQCYIRPSNRRPPSRNYQGIERDTEVRWYRYEQNLVDRLTSLGFTMDEINKAYHGMVAV